MEQFNPDADSDCSEDYIVFVSPVCRRIQHEIQSTDLSSCCTQTSQLSSLTSSTSSRLIEVGSKRDREDIVRMAIMNDNDIIILNSAANYFQSEGLLCYCA